MPLALTSSGQLAMTRMAHTPALAPPALAPAPDVLVSFPLVLPRAVTVSWSLPSDGLARAFRVYRADPTLLAGDGTPALVYEGVSLMFYDAGRAPGTTYGYAVSVQRPDSGWSAPTRMHSVTTRRE